MANYTTLENLIRAKVYENGNNEITGQDLQDVLLQMVSEMGKSGMICLGVATTSTTPPAGSDSNIFYLAEGAGTYTNFGGLSVDVGEVALFIWNGSTWDKQSVNVVEIVDNLTTNDSTKALSAKQGKVLNDALQAIRQTLASMDILDNVAGSAVELLNPIAENAEFTFQKSGSKGDGAALINSIKGKTLAWNQLVQNPTIQDTHAGWTCSFDIFSETSDMIALTNLNGSLGFYTPASIIVGHKYYITCSVKYNSLDAANAVSILYFGGGAALSISPAEKNTPDYVTKKVLVTANDAQWGFSIYPAATGDILIIDKKSGVNIIDLTILGIDNLTTVAEVEAWLATDVGLRSYYPFNAGELKSNDAQSIVTEGRNQWDEEWEQGYWSNGAISPLVNYICSKNKIRVLSEITYYLTIPTNASLSIYGFSGNDWLGEIRTLSASGLYTIPSGVDYITFACGGSGHPLSSYNHDICINISDASFNGQYEPYWKNTLELNIKTLTGKKDGQGASVTIFPDGAGGVGSVYDELRKSVAYKRCGIRAYQAGDESDSSVITDGTNTIYVLTTPETYVLDTPLKMTYKVAKGGTEERISPNADGISAPMVEEVQYPMQTKGDAGYDISVNDGNPATIDLYLPIDATGAVFLSCGGATFSALVSAGQTTLSISGIASGTYTFVAMYSGDGKYAPFSASDTVTIS